MLKSFCFLLVALWASVARAGIDDAIVMLEGCSGVCVDSSGLVLTVKHCSLPETVTVRFKDRTVSAKRVYVSAEIEGPVVFDCEGDGYPCLPVAATAPRSHEKVWSYGYPHIGNRREFRWASGPAIRWSTFEYGGGSFNGNVVGFGTCPGWSGGPLVNAKGEVCGLLNSSDGWTSIFVSSAAVRQAYEATRPHVQSTVDDGRPKLIVFGSMSCTPCRQFKQDYAQGTEMRKTLESAFAVEFVDVDEQPDVARKWGVTQVPTFLIPGRAPIIRYEGAEKLLIALGLKTENLDPKASKPDPDDPEPAEKTPADVPTEPVLVKTPEVPETPTAPVETTPPKTPNLDSLERLSGLVEKAVTVATWLGVGGLTGGTGGLILGGLALWRNLRKRRRPTQPGRDPPQQSPIKPPPVVTIDSPPPPQAILTETHFTPYERDTFSEAFAWAETQMARKYPGSVGTLESLRGLINQFLSSQGSALDPVRATARK